MGSVSRILIVVALLALAGCQTAKGGFCDIASPIRLSPETVAAMTDAEVKDALAHNRKGEKLCGWRP